MNEYSLYVCRYCGSVRAAKPHEIEDTDTCRAVVKHVPTGETADIERMMIGVLGKGEFKVCGGPLMPIS